MAVSTASNQTSVVLTSTTQAIPISFPFFADSDLVVVRTDQATLSDTTLAITTHYTVTGGNGATGTVTIINGAAIGDTITIFRSIPYTQTTELEEGDPLPSAVLEQRLDRLTIQILQVKAIAERALRLGETSPAIGAGDIKDPTSKFLGFDASDQLQAYTSAQMQSLIGLTVTASATAVWADATARALEVPAYVGQMGLQLDTNATYRAHGLLAGDWTLLDRLDPANNLSDVENTATARANLETLQDADDVITSAYLATDSVTADAIAAGVVGADELAGAAVGEAQLSNGAVTESKIGAGAVTVDKLGANSVTSTKLSDNSVTFAKFATQAAHTMLLNHTSGTAVPTATKVSALAEEAAPASGDWLFGEASGGAIRKFDVGKLQTGWVLQSSATLSNDSSADFTDLDATSVHVFVLTNLVPVTDSDALAMRVSDDNGSSFESGSSDYKWCQWRFNSNAATGSVEDDADGELHLADGVGSGSGEHGVCGLVQVYGAGEASYKTGISAEIMFWYSSGYSNGIAFTGAYETAGAINGVRFFLGAATWRTGKIGKFTIREN